MIANLISNFRILNGTAVLALAFPSLAIAQEPANPTPQQGTSLASAVALDPVSIVFTIDGVSRSFPISNLTLQGGNYVVKNPVDGGLKSIAASAASHISGSEPPQIAEAVGLMLMNKPSDAVALLEPIMSAQQMTAKITGNYWIKAARAALVAHSMNRASSKCVEIGKAISDATPEAGDDPSVGLSNAMLTSLSVSIKDRIAALESLANDASPPEVSAYASYFRGNLLKTAKRNKEAIEAYLTIPAVYPTGGRVIVAAAELNAGELIATLNRREEAILCLDDAIREGKGTIVGAEAERRKPLVK